MGNWSSFWTSVNPNEYSGLKIDANKSNTEKHPFSDDDKIMKIHCLGRCYTLDLANRTLGIVFIEL